MTCTAPNVPIGVNFVFTAVGTVAAHPVGPDRSITSQFTTSTAPGNIDSNSTNNSITVTTTYDSPDSADVTIAKSTTHARNTCG
jgi:hypothetical protein